VTTTTGGRSGRRPGSADTRGLILEAARTAFAAGGYESTTIRGIATAAGVDPALVHHYFGTKEAVFVAALEFPFDPGTMIPTVLAGPREALGERLVRTLLAIWAEPAGREPVLALLRSAMTNEAAATMLREFLTRALVGRLAALLGPPDAELRGAVTGSQLVGLALVRYVVRLEPLASATDDEVVALVAPTIQRYLLG
jgi:AcrR family transcriptional regulator